MQQNDYEQNAFRQAEPPKTAQEQYKVIASMSIKGKSSALMNFIAMVLFVGVFVLSVIFFPPEKNDLRFWFNWLVYVFVGLLAMVLACVIMMALKCIFLKIFGAKKLGFHFGGLADVYSKNPLPKIHFILADFLSSIIILIALLVWMLFCLNVLFLDIISFTAFGFFFANWIVSASQWIFELRQPKGTYFVLENGVIQALLLNEQDG